MKRKLVTLLCVLALAVSLLPVVTAAAEAEGECNHEYECGSTQIVLVRATCTKNAKSVYICRLCGEICGELEIDNTALGHNLVDVKGKASTCTEAGWSDYKKCGRCDYVEGKTELPLAEHKWQEMDGLAPSCNAAGHERFKICTVCGAVEGGATLNPLGHDWGEWKVTMEPTCTDAGKQVRTCQRVDCGKTEEEAVPAKGHDWGEWAVETPGSCTVKSVEKRSCKSCSAFETRETDYVHGETYVTELAGATKPTCTEAGEKALLTWCKDCGGLVKKEIVKADPLGHDVKDWTVTVEPTCVKPGEKQGVCQRCGETVTETVAATGKHELDYDKAYRMNEKKPTCTEEGGYNLMVPCKTCDGVQNKGWQVLEKEPHTQGKWEAVDSKTHHAKCEVCGNECAVENHKFVSKVIREATEKQKGLRQYTCKGCDYSYTVEFAYDPTLDDVPKTGDSMGIALVTGLSLCMAAVLPLKKWMR